MANTNLPPIIIKCLSTGIASSEKHYINLFIYLFYRALTVCSNSELLHKEKTHLRNALTQCSYPKWALDKVERRLNKPSSEDPVGANNQATTGSQPATKEVKTKGHIVIPYTQGLCESIKTICGRYGIETYLKSSNIIRNLLVSPKDKDPMVNQSGAIYWFQCDDLLCDDEYIRGNLQDLWWKIQRAHEGPLTHSSTQ